MKNLVVSTPLVLFSHTLSNVGYPMKVFGIPYFKVLARVARSMVSANLASSNRPLVRLFFKVNLVSFAFVSSSKRRTSCKRPC